MADQRILVVDDEESICNLLKMLTEDMGAEMVVAMSGEAGLEELNAGRFDVVVLDKNLPGMSGVELATTLREQDADVSIVMMTAYGNVESALHMLHLRVERYIEKPFDVEDMQRVLEAGIAETRRRRTASGLHKQDGQHLQQGTNIFVVVPNDAERQWLVSQLMHTHTVHAFDSSQAALDGLKDTLPNLIIADAGLRDPSTSDMLARFRDLGIDTNYGLVARTLRLQDVKSFIDIGITFVVNEPLTEDAFKKKFEIFSGRRGKPPGV